MYAITFSVSIFTFLSSRKYQQYQNIKIHKVTNESMNIEKKSDFLILSSNFNF